MTEHENHDHKDTKLKELVAVTETCDWDHAKECETLLRNNDIHCILQENPPTEDGESVTVSILVPEESIDEAHVVIESQNAYDDFYDASMEDDDDMFDFDLDEDDYLGEEF